MADVQLFRSLVLDGRHRPAVLFSVGPAITPLLAMLGPPSSPSTGAHHAVFLAVARNPQPIGFADEIAEVAQRWHGIKLILPPEVDASSRLLRSKEITGVTFAHLQRRKGRPQTDCWCRPTATRRHFRTGPSLRRWK